MNLNLTKFNDYQACSAHVAKLIVKKIIDKPSLTLALPTGRSATPIYEQLVRLIKQQNVDCTHLKTFNLDEYIGLEKTNINSFYSYMNKNLFKPLNLSIKQTLFPSEKNPQSYDEIINQCGGIDLCLLGMGINGHIAFNEPGSKRSSKTRCVELTSSTLKSNKSLFEANSIQPQKAVTIGLESILKSKEIFLLCNTKEKWKILSPYLSKIIVDPQFPVSYLIEHPNTQIFHV